MALAARSPSDGLLAGKSAGRRALPVLRQAPVSLLCAVDSAASKRAGFHEASNSAVFKAKTSLSAADLLMLLSPTVASSANIGAINGGPYACRECSNKFPSLHSLDFHYQTYHTKDKKNRPVDRAVGGSSDSAEPAGSGSPAPSKSGTPPPTRVAGRRARLAASQETLGESGSAGSAAAASQSLRRSPSLSPSPSATTLPSSGAGEDVAAGAMATATGGAKSSPQQRRGAKRSRADSQPGGTNPSAPATKRGGRRCAGVTSEKLPVRVTELRGCAAGAQIATMDAGRSESVKVEMQRLGRHGLAGKKWQPPSVLVTGGADRTVGDVRPDGGALTPSDSSAVPQPRRIGALAGSCLTLTDRMNSLTSSLTDLTAAGSNPVSPTTPTNVPLFGGASGAASGGCNGGGFSAKVAAHASQLQQLMALVMQEQEKRGRMARVPEQTITEHIVTEQRVKQPEPNRLQSGQSVAASDAKGITSLNTLLPMQPPLLSNGCLAQRPSPSHASAPALATVRQVVTSVTPGAPAADSPSFLALNSADGRQGASSTAQGPGDVAGSQLSMLVAVLASRLSQQKAPVAAGEGAVTTQQLGEMELLKYVQGQGVSGAVSVAQCRDVDLDLRL